MRLAVVTINPNDAHRMLLEASGQRQRNLNRRRVTQYAAEMKAGRWAVTHQPIAFDPDGVLIDGQHRLSAIVAAGVPVTVSVCYDADPDTFGVVDNGWARTPAAALTIAGYGNTAILSAAARHYLTYHDVVGTKTTPTGQHRSNHSSVALVAFMDTRPGQAILGSITEARRIAISVGRVGTGTWLAACLGMLEVYGTDPETRSEFLERLENGTMLEVGSPILALRRWLTSDAHGYGAVRRDVAAFSGMAAFIKAWNGWLDSERMMTVHFRAGSEEAPKLEAHRTVLDMQDTA